MTPEIRHIVFDIGKVLIHYDPELPFKRIIADDEKRRWFLGEVCTSDWNIEQDRGRSWPDAEAELIARHPDQADTIQAFRQNWAEMVPYAMDANVAMLKRLLDQGRDLTFLTNFAADTFVEAQAMYPFLTLGRGVTVSGRVGLIKPDPAIYALHQDTFSLDPAHTLFIDDSAPNIVAARNHGWHGIHLPPGTDLESELRAFGL